MEQLLKFKEEGMITEVAFEVLSRLISQKEDENRWRNYRNRYGTFMLFVIYPALLFLLYRLNIGEYLRDMITSEFLDIVTNQLVWSVLFVIYISHHIWFWINNKLKEYEDDCDELREEVIDRIEELLDGENRKYRDQIFSHLKKVYDINMYTKN